MSEMTKNQQEVAYTLALARNDPWAKAVKYIIDYGRSAQFTYPTTREFKLSLLFDGKQPSPATRGLLARALILFGYEPEVDIYGSYLTVTYKPYVLPEETHVSVMAKPTDEQNHKAFTMALARKDPWAVAAQAVIDHGHREGNKVAVERDFNLRGLFGGESPSTEDRKRLLSSLVWFGYQSRIVKGGHVLRVIMKPVVEPTVSPKVSKILVELEHARKAGVQWARAVDTVVDYGKSQQFKVPTLSEYNLTSLFMGYSPNSAERAAVIEALTEMGYAPYNYPHTDRMTLVYRPENFVDVTEAPEPTAQPDEILTAADALEMYQRGHDVQAEVNMDLYHKEYDQPWAVAAREVCNAIRILVNNGEYKFKVTNKVDDEVQQMKLFSFLTNLGYKLTHLKLMIGWYCSVEWAPQKKTVL